MNFLVIPQHCIYLSLLAVLRSQKFTQSFPSVWVADLQKHSWLCSNSVFFSLCFSFVFLSLFRLFFFLYVFFFIRLGIIIAIWIPFEYYYYFLFLSFFRLFFISILLLLLFEYNYDSFHKRTIFSVMMKWKVNIGVKEIFIVIIILFISFNPAVLF